MGLSGRERKTVSAAAVRSAGEICESWGEIFGKLELRRKPREAGVTKTTGRLLIAAIWEKERVVLPLAFGRQWVDREGQ